MTKMHKTKSAKLNQGTISVIGNQLIMNVYTETRRISQTYGKAKSKLDEPTVQPFTSYNTARFLLLLLAQERVQKDNLCVKIL